MKPSLVRQEITQPIQEASCTSIMKWILKSLVTVYWSIISFGKVKRIGQYSLDANLGVLHMNHYQI